MTSIFHEGEHSLWPGLMQSPGRRWRAYHVIATLHDDGWQVANTAHIANQLVFRKKSFMAEVVRFQSPHAQRHGIRAKCLDVLRMWQQVQATTLVTTPAARCCTAYCSIVTEQAF